MGRIKDKPWTYEFQSSDFEDAQNGVRPFDYLYWFGVDQANQLAVFNSSGFGPIPLAALQDFEGHKRASIQLFGGMMESQFEEAIANCGMHYFEWNYERAQYQAGIPYVKVLRGGAAMFQDCPSVALVKGVAVSLPVIFTAIDQISAEQMNLQLNV